MSNIQLNEAYADWVSSQHYDLILHINAEQELTYEQMSSLICKFFYKAECDVFGYSNREKYKKALRIKRVVAIEGDEKRTHAHIKVKTLVGWTDEQMIELLRLTYRHITKAKKDKAFLFKAEPIRHKQNSSGYITKDTQRQNEKLNDVICLRSSFISKHSKDD